MFTHPLVHLGAIDLNEFKTLNYVSTHRFTHHKEIFMAHLYEHPPTERRFVLVLRDSVRRDDTSPYLEMMWVSCDKEGLTTYHPYQNIAGTHRVTDPSVVIGHLINHPRSPQRWRLATQSPAPLKLEYPLLKTMLHPRDRCILASSIACFLTLHYRAYP